MGNTSIPGVAGRVPGHSHGRHSRHVTGDRGDNAADHDWSVDLYPVSSQLALFYSFDYKHDIKKFLLANDRFTLELNLID